MTESDVKSVEFRRFVRWVRAHAKCDCIAADVLARGMIDQLQTAFAPTNCPRGDIGRCTNDDIAEGCGWLGDPDELVTALVAAGRLIEHADDRLRIARWSGLAPAWLRSNVKAMGGFVDVDNASEAAATAAPRKARRNDCRKGGREDGRNADRNESRNEGLEPAVLSIPPLSIPSSPSSPPPREDAGEWQEVGEVLKNLGMARWQDALATVQANGGTASDAKAIIDHWQERDGAWELGDLYGRLLRFAPGQAPSTGWRKPSAEWTRREDQREAKAKLKRDALLRSEQEARDAETREREASLAAEWGPAVDRLTDDEIRERLAENGPLLKKFQRGGRTPIVRDWLISRLSREEVAV